MAFSPDRVTALIWPPADLPNSAEYEFVRTWNSRTASTPSSTPADEPGVLLCIINVGAIEQKVVLLGPGAVNGNLRRAPANDVVARGQCGSDSRLKKRELLERPA